MSDIIQPNFEQGLQQDIERLSSEVKLQRERPEMKDVSHQEILRQSIKAMSPTQAEPATLPQTDSASILQNPLPDYAQSAPAETKLEIEHLLEVAFREGIMKANGEAARSSPFVLDAFHDSLVGKLYPELKRRGIVE